MATNLLKVNRESYAGQISLLQGYLNQLDSTITDYQTLENELDSFMDGSDDNYDKLRENIEYNISLVQRAREMTNSSIETLQQTLDSFDDLGTNIGNVIEDAKELAGNVKTVIDVMNIIE